MKSSCVLDCQTEIGIVSLTLDQKQPDFLLISIDGEPRRSVYLGEYDIQFHTLEDARHFLRKLRDSEFLHQIIEQEKHLNDTWDRY